MDIDKVEITLKGISEYLKAGNSVDAINRHGATLLHFAALNGEDNVIRLLLRWGAKKEAKTNLGLTAYDWAFTRCNHEVTAMLNPKMSELPTPSRTYPELGLR